MSSARHFWISGKVQGVSFRASACQQARSLGLTGWVRNLSDGRVEALAAGEQGALDEFEAWLWQGSELARVDEVKVAPASGPLTAGFEQR